MARPLSGITKRQQDVLDFIKSYMGSYQRPPTNIEIAAHFGYRSPNAANEHLKRLVRHGCIAVDHKQHRGIRILEAA